MLSCNDQWILISVALCKGLCGGFRVMNKILSVQDGALKFFDQLLYQLSVLSH